MGNYVSCTLAGSPAGGPRSSKVILPDGEVRRLAGPANAAELMLDVPGHFLVSSRSMQVGRRFAPLVADEDLEAGEVYVMFPMKRMNAVVTAADMAGLLMAASKEIRRASGGRARVLPDSTTQMSAADRVVPSTAVKQQEEVVDETMTGDESAAEIGEFMYRMSVSRSRRPSLETILEEGIIACR